YMPLQGLKEVPTKRSWSPYGLRAWPGQESMITRLPSVAPSRMLPRLSTSAGCTPKNGRAAEPGFIAWAPGSGVIRQAPVSVCHQVSTIGQRRSEERRVGKECRSRWETDAEERSKDVQASRQ